MTKISNVPGGHNNTIFSVPTRKKKCARGTGHALKSGLEWGLEDERKQG
jgi:hypothetical protein